MTIAVFPGSFDPMTLGHVDIVRRALTFVDEVIVGVGANPSKSHMFTPEQRLELAAQSLEGIDGASALAMPGLLVDFCRSVGASVVVKGIRGMGDYAGEEPMALMNRNLSGIETVFVLANPELAHVASSLVKDVARHGGNIKEFVAPGVARAIMHKVTIQENS